MSKTLYVTSNQGDRPQNSVKGKIYMKTIAGLILASILASLSTTVLAGACVGCKIMSIGSGPNYDRTCPTGTCVYIRVDATEGNFTRPACSSSPDWVLSDWHYTLDASTPSGRNSLSQVLVALTTQKKITIGGAGKCEVYAGGNTEDFDYMYFSW